MLARQVRMIDPNPHAPPPPPPKVHQVGFFVENDQNATLLLLCASEDRQNVVVDCFCWLAGLLLSSGHRHGYRQGNVHLRRDQVDVVAVLWVDTKLREATDNVALQQRGAQKKKASPAVGEVAEKMRARGHSRVERLPFCSQMEFVEYHGFDVGESSEERCFGAGDVVRQGEDDCGEVRCVWRKWIGSVDEDGFGDDAAVPEATCSVELIGDNRSGGRDEEEGYAVRNLA